MFGIRLAVALAALALLSAGCLGGPATGIDDPADATPTTETTPTTDPGTADSPSDDRGFDAADFAEGPKERPERPDELTASSATDYARIFEYRRAYNSLWMGEGTDLDLSCEAHDVEAVDGGYDVLISCTGYANGGGEPEPNSTATTTPIHADWFTQYFVYRVTEDGTERRRATEDERRSNELQ